MGRGHQLTARRYFDNHHHNAVARAAAKAADINNAGMQPFTNSRVAGLVILNISVAYNPSEDRLPLFPGYPAALFPSHVSDCSAIHLLALASLEKPLDRINLPVGPSRFYNPSDCRRRFPAGGESWARFAH
jgi:hypothetical protein